MGMVDAAVVLEELGRTVHPSPYASSAVGATGLLVDLDAAGLFDDVLSDLAAGTAIATLGLLEPGRRATWSDPTTTARAQGDAWVLEGTKVHVPDSLAATVLLISARDEHGVTGVFIVPADATGIAVAPTPAIDGTRKA